MAQVRVKPLTCPDCGRSLLGLRYDRVFFCMNCRTGHLSTDEGWKKFPLFFAQAEAPRDARILYLPMWRLEVEVEADPVNPNQERSLKRIDEMKYVWVTGYHLIRPSYFGDLGLAYTEQNVDPPPDPEPPDPAFVAGCIRDPKDAQRYAELYVTMILDKRADVTGMGIMVIPTQISLWAVPMHDLGDKMMDLFTGITLPAFAIDDLEDLRRIRQRKSA